MSTTTKTESVETAAARRDQQDELARRRTVLRIRGLRKAFGGQVVLDGVTADLREGEVVLLRGSNGSGKTTLLNILSGNLEPDNGSIHLQVNGAAEHFEFPRNWWDNLNPFDHFTPERVAREGVGRTWQDVRLFDTLTLADNIAVASPHQAGENPINILLRHGRMRRQECCNREATSERLTSLGFTDHERSSGDQISLGQSKHVAIARAIQAGARILFLDEPLAGLDATGIAKVLELLRKLVRDHRVTLVIVEHVFNIPRILDLADTVWTLQDGRISIEAPTAVRAQRVDSFDADIVPWITKQLGHSLTVATELLEGGAVLTKLHAALAVTAPEAPFFEIRDLVVRRGGRPVIGKPDEVSGEMRGLSFRIARGDIGILHAVNGWGKTTLAEAIMGILPIEKGHILLDNQAIHPLCVWDRIKAGVQLLRSRDALFSNLTVEETIRLAGANRYESTALPPAARRLGSLSGGEKQRVNIASLKPSLLGIYDEPFTGLDQLALSSFMNTKAIRNTSAMLILVPQV